MDFLFISIKSLSGSRRSQYSVCDLGQARTDGISVLSLEQHLAHCTSVSSCISCYYLGVSVWWGEWVLCFSFCYGLLCICWWLSWRSGNDFRLV